MSDAKRAKKKPFFTDWRIGLVCVFTLALVIYLPSLNGVAIWDDVTLINGAQFGGNDFYHAFFHPFGNYFRPLTSASFVLDSMVAEAMHAKEVPIFYHQTNILLHAFTAPLVAILAFLITEKKLAGILAGVFFAFQPMQVSAVAWIGGRTDALSAFFIAAFFVTVVLYAKTGKARWIAPAAVCYLLGALAKEQVAAIIPVVPFALVWIGKQSWKEALRKSSPFLAPFLLYVGFYLFKGPIPQKVSNGFFDTVLLSLRTDAFYGFAFLVPNARSLVTYTVENYLGIGWLFLAAALVVGFLFLFARAVKSHRKIAWLALCGLFLYLPVCNFPTLPSMVVATYRLANGGILIACLFGILAAYCVTRKQYLYAGAVGVNLLVGLGVTWWGVHQWLTVKDFFGVVAQNDPHFLIGVLDYTQAIDKDGDHKEAIRLTDQTLTWFFDTPDWLDKLEQQKMAAVTPDVHKKLQANFGMPMLQTLGNFVGQNAYFHARNNEVDLSRRVAHMAQILAPRDPWVQDLYARLIVSVDKEEAIKDWKIALSLNPDFADPAISLGRMCQRDSKYAQAAVYFRQALKTVPYSGPVWLMLANAHVFSNQLDGVSEELDRAEKSPFPADKDEIDDLRDILQFAKTHQKLWTQPGVKPAAPSRARSESHR